MNELNELMYELSIKYNTLNGQSMPHNPMYFLAKLAEETGEVAEAVIANLGSVKKQNKIKAKGSTPEEELVLELGDVLNVIFLLGYTFGIKPNRIISAAVHKMRAKRIEWEKQN